MKRIIVVAALFAGLAGCAGSGRMPELNQYQAEYEPLGSVEAVSAVSFRRAGPGGNLPQCVAATITNQGETLKDSSGSFVGAYTGTYYSVDRTTQTSGGSVIEYAAPDGSSVVASGSTKYAANALVSRSVRFKLSVKQDESGRLYRYGSLGQAQLNTGVATNTGYTAIGAWSGANPDLAAAALSKVTDEIERCLN